MSAARHRSLARLPVNLFEGLQHHRLQPIDDFEADATKEVSALSALELRTRIVAKLKNVSIPSSNDQQSAVAGSDGIHPNSAALWSSPPPSSLSRSITTVGTLLQGLSPWSLVQVLDPLLTFPECCELYRRICLHTAPKPITALALLSQTTTNDPPTPHHHHCNETSSSLATLETVHARRTASICNNGVGSAAALPRYWPTGWNALDASLGGGLRLGTIVEVVGAAGTGKTQLAMQLAVTSILRQCPQWATSTTHTSTDTVNLCDFGGGCIYIDTEQKISPSRLSELAAATIATRSSGATTLDATRHGRSANDNLHVVLHNIGVFSPSSTAELRHVLQTLEEEILTRNQAASEWKKRVESGHRANDAQHHARLPVRLLVIDSIAAPLRRGGGDTAKHSSAASQAAAVLQMAQTVKRLADQFNLVVCIINQVGSVYSPSLPLSSGNSLNHNSHNHQQQLQQPTPITVGGTRAALGTAWHHCVSTRIELHCQNGTCGPGIRYGLVVKSNVVDTSHAPIPFCIATQGLIDGQQ
jgi:RecA/RadA recombinase